MENLDSKAIFQFIAFCKRVLNIWAIRYYREKGFQKKREVPLTDLSEKVLAELYQKTPDFTKLDYFEAAGQQIGIASDRLADALRQLDFRDQQILLYYYFLGFRNQEIADFYGCTATTISRRKASAVRELAALMSRGKGREEEGKHGRG